MQKFSYHTHTNFSDGAHSLEDMLETAVRLGWTEIGISDHLIVHKNMKKSPAYSELMKYSAPHIYHSSFAEIRDEYHRHAEKVRKVAKSYPLKVYLGYEADYFRYDGWEDEFREFIKEMDHDYLISGNHFFQSEDFENITDVFRYDDLSENSPNESFPALLKRHYETIEKAVRSGLFDFLAHMDYARKVSEHQKYPMTDERLNIVRALKETATGCEVSTKGLRKIGDFYPAPFVIKALIEQKVPLVISDDAHRTDELGLDFDKAEKILHQMNCQNRFRLKSCL